MDANAAIDCWIGLGLAQRFGEADEVPLYAAYPLQREFLLGSGRLSADLLQLCHQQAASFLQVCYENDREAELRLSVIGELFWCFHHASEAEDRERQRWAAVRIARVLHQRGEYQTVLELLEPLLLTDCDPDLLSITGRALFSTGEKDKARRYFDEARMAYEAAANQQGIIDTLGRIATIEHSEGLYQDAGEKLSEALTRSRNISYREGEVMALTALAAIDVSRGNYQAARGIYDKVLRILQFTHDPKLKAEVLYHLASIELREKRYQEARQFSNSALVIIQAFRDRLLESAVSHQLGSIDLKEAQYGDARRNFEMALKIRQAIGNRPGEAASLHQLGSIDIYEHKYREASVKFREALSLLEEIEDPVAEAGIFFQIGVLALTNLQVGTGIRLVALTYLIELNFQLPGQKETRAFINSISSRLSLDEEGWRSIFAEAQDEYQRDRAASLVHQALA